MSNVIISSRELIPYLSQHCFKGCSDLAEVVRDYSQGTPPPVDAITWQVARRCFKGCLSLTGIVQEYNLGVSVAYLEIAERVQSAESQKIVSRILTECHIHYMFLKRDPWDRERLRSACLYMLSNVDLIFKQNMDGDNPFRQDNISKTLDSLEMARRVLTGINALHPLNTKDPVTKCEIADHDLLMTPTGHRFSLSALVENHHSRWARSALSESVGNKFLINPLDSTPFEWPDVQSIMIAVGRSEHHQLTGLHQRYLLVSEEIALLAAWPSLQHFQSWVNSNAGTRDEDALYRLIHEKEINVQVEDHAQFLEQHLDLPKNQPLSLPPEEREPCLLSARREQEERRRMVRVHLGDRIQIPLSDSEDGGRWGELHALDHIPRFIRPEEHLPGPHGQAALPIPNPTDLLDLIVRLLQQRPPEHVPAANQDHAGGDVSEGEDDGSEGLMDEVDRS